MVFRAPRPFRPQRLWQWIGQMDDGRLGRILRSQGGVARFEPSGVWDPEAGMVPGQELVLIGQGLRREQIVAGPQDCLLTEAEMAPGPDAWRELPDPMPAWAELPEHQDCPDHH